MSYTGTSVFQVPRQLRLQRRQRAVTPRALLVASICRQYLPASPQPVQHQQQVYTCPIYLQTPPRKSPGLPPQPHLPPALSLLQQQQEVHTQQEPPTTLGPL